MRFTTSKAGMSVSDAFNDGVRPALDKVPRPLATLIRERDRIMAQRFAALTKVTHLATAEIEQAARRTDDEAASKAARAGKEVPPATALPKLEAERADAARTLDAQEGAFAAVTGECGAVASDLYWGNLETITADRAKVRDEIAAQATALADAVEAAVDAFSISDWLCSGSYDRTATTWPGEVVDLRRHGLTREATTPVDVRAVIVRAATTVLEEPTTN